jgi:hypothetical protein
MEDSCLNYRDAALVGESHALSSWVVATPPQQVQSWSISLGWLQYHIAVALVIYPLKNSVPYYNMFFDITYSDINFSVSVTLLSRFGNMGQWCRCRSLTAVSGLSCACDPSNAACSGRSRTPIPPTPHQKSHLRSDEAPSAANDLISGRYKCIYHPAVRRHPSPLLLANRLARPLAPGAWHMSGCGEALQLRLCSGRQAAGRPGFGGREALKEKCRDLSRVHLADVIS